MKDNGQSTHCAEYRRQRQTQTQKQMETETQTLDNSKEWLATQKDRVDSEERSSDKARQRD